MAVVGLVAGVVAVLVAFSMTSEPFDVDVAGPVGGSSTTSAMVSSSSTAFQVGPCGPPPTRPANPTEEDRKAFDASVEQSMAEAASGWIRFQGEDVVNGGWMCGWMRTPPKDPAEIIAAGKRQEVYDAIDGTLLGYAYVGLGFVPAAVADAPGFDPSTLGD